MGQITGESPVNPGVSSTEQVDRILHSRTFQNTEVLKRLLDYLARQALSGDAADLKEYTVGVEAFGKPATYDPQSDSSVRVQAGKLRQKLEEYYRVEGAGDPLRVELPKGHFRLEFHPQAAPRPDPTPAAERTSPSRRWLWAAALVVVLAAGILLWRGPLARTGGRERWNSDMEAFWKPLLSSPRPIMVAIGTPLFEKIGNSFFRDPGLNTWEAAGQSERLKKVQEAAGESPVSPAYNYTGVGEAAGAFALSQLLAPQGRELAFQVSNQVNWEDIARNNMIFLGPPKFALQTADLPVAQDFEISHGRVQNLRPAPGEPQSFEEKWSPDRSRLEVGHALITRIPGLHGTGEILILAGSSTESTRAAAEFVTRPEYMTPFVRYMRQSHGGVPDWFQVVVRARFRSLTPISIERVAFHVLK
jgi:hypothetical protein